MSLALDQIRDFTINTPFENDLYLVGGAIRDELMGLPVRNDFDLVTTGDAIALAESLAALSTIPPVTYPRYGTALLKIAGSDIELVRARRESYHTDSRKPNVEPATLQEDAMRRDFTINALMRSLHTGELLDPTGRGLTDLKNRFLRIPLDPEVAFIDDPLRMLRAVRFKWRLDFELDPAAEAAIVVNVDRLAIVSFERIRDELFKILDHPSAPDAFNHLMSLGLLRVIAPEFLPMVDCEQGKYHHLDVWHHSLLVMRNIGPDSRLDQLAALFHDIGKPPTRIIDDKGNTRFFGHESVGAEMTQRILARWKLPQKEIDHVVRLVKNHMRLGSSKTFSPTAARRLIRDMGEQLEPLLRLVDADANALKAGVKALDLSGIRSQIAKVGQATPRHTLQSPLSGGDIMALTGVSEGRLVGELKSMLTERVLEGDLDPTDRSGAEQYVSEFLSRKSVNKIR